MPNKKMIVLAVVGQKGGAGKSTICRAIAAAALTEGRRVHMIDADPQAGLKDWYNRIMVAGGGPLPDDDLTLEWLPQLDDIRDSIDRHYQAGKTDVVLIDSKGELSESSAYVMMEADALLLPVMATSSDITAQAKTVRFYEALREQAEGDFPPLAAVISRFPAKPSKVQVACKEEIEDTFPVIRRVVMDRAAYISMDEEGFLHTLLKKRRDAEDPIMRLQARNFEEALSDAADVFNQVSELADEA